MSKKFDFDNALEELQSAQTMIDKDDVLTPSNIITGMKIQHY